MSLLAVVAPFVLLGVVLLTTLNLQRQSARRRAQPALRPVRLEDVSGDVRRAKRAGTHQTF